MLKRTRPILLIAILALLVAAPIAAAKKTYKYSSTATSSPVLTTDGYPSVGGSAILAGSLKSTPFGPGTVIDHLTVTGQPQANVFTFEGTEVDLFADGTAGNTFTGTATVQSDGSQAIVIHGRYAQGRNQGPNQVLFGPGGPAATRASPAPTPTPEPSPPGPTSPPAVRAARWPSDHGLKLSHEPAGPASQNGAAHAGRSVAL